MQAVLKRYKYQIETSDDAGVYRLNHSQAIVQTVDFFTPVVDDPYSFGQIAAANALSDIYAMGASPLTALNLVSFPIHKLDKSILLDILRGGREKIEEAGAVVIGGHSIDDPEPKYGLAVTGLIHPDKILTNRGALENDFLVLTKPLGIGIITTGIKRGIVSKTEENEAVKMMAMLNKTASEVACEVGVHACTDVTGFGLLGHLHEMMRASGLCAEIYTANVPVIESVWSCLDKGAIPGGTMANLAYLEKNLLPFCSERWKLILGDAQTSGGLLLAVEEKKKEELLRKLWGVNHYSRIIGRVYRGETGKISIYEDDMELK
ncbi:MAG: selenide, water dikinase SelD [Peptococcaceae bacterium]|nr:selenide, water dikinase SelD [Peptococcaceae bacterium]